jgi:hypothetical protein
MADSKNSTPVTATQCQRYGSKERVVVRGKRLGSRKINGNQMSNSMPERAAGTRT